MVPYMVRITRHPHGLVGKLAAQLTMHHRAARVRYT